MHLVDLADNRGGRENYLHENVLMENTELQNRQFAETSWAGVDCYWDFQWKKALGARMLHHTLDDLIASSSLHTPGLVSVVGGSEYFSTALTVRKQISQHSLLQASG
jgi:hypothetical protein